MHFLDYFCEHTLKFDLINKFHYTNLKKLPRLKQVVLNFSCKTTELKVFAKHMLALQLITKQKGVVTTSKRPNLLLRLRKGSPAGCKITLKKVSMLHFLSKNLNENFSKTKNFDEILLYTNIEKNTLSFSIKNTLNFSELIEHYYLFNNLSNLSLSLVTSAQTKEETLFLLRSLQIPLKTILLAGITQLVEYNLAKIKAKGSNPFIC